MGRVVRHFAEFGMAKVATVAKVMAVRTARTARAVRARAVWSRHSTSCMPCLGSWMAQEHSPQVSGQR